MKGQLTIQNPKSYTKEDQQTWSSLFEKFGARLDKEARANKDFWEWISKLKIKKGEIPSIESLNKILKSASNIELIAVTGDLEDNIHFQLVKSRKFPVRITLPEFFYDVFGKVPFFGNKLYTDSLVEFAGNVIANNTIAEQREEFNNRLFDATRINETYTTTE